MNDFKKYLPSKKFVTILIIISLIIALFFAFKSIKNLLKDKISDNEGKVVSMTVGNIIGKDSNENGIADWEEYLWGLNPAKNGKENRNFILSKKKELEDNGIISVSQNSKKITDNELLSMQFFATIVSLQQTGQLDNESIKSVSDAIGENIEATPIDNIYVKKDIILTEYSKNKVDIYRENVSKLFKKYEGADMGSELNFVFQGLTNKDPQALYVAKTVAESYRSLGQEFIKIPVPESLADMHLNIANNYEKIAISINGLAEILNDPLIGMRSLINYKNYSDSLSTDIENLYNALQ